MKTLSKLNRRQENFEDAWNYYRPSNDSDERQVMEDDLPSYRYLLVESGGSTWHDVWFSLHQTRRDAVSSHEDDGYWRITVLINLDTGDEFVPQYNSRITFTRENA
jgi:hypothetical protein